MTELEPLGAVLGRLLPSGGGTVEYCLKEVWSSCVGADIAQNAQPLSLRKGRLVVATSSPAWAHALQLMEDQIVDRLNRARGILCAAGVSALTPSPFVASSFGAGLGWEPRRPEERRGPADR